MINVIKITEKDIELTRKTLESGKLPKDKKSRERVSTVISKKMRDALVAGETEKYEAMKKFSDALFGNMV